MTSTSIKDALSSPHVYRLWQSPQAFAKLRPILRENRLEEVSRVLDVGCGPGTNAQLFESAYYVGMDLNPRYIEYAAKKFGRDFRVQDVRDFKPSPDERFDFVLANSLFHHLSDDETHSVLGALGGTLTDDGHVHIIDLILPAKRSIARFLAEQDRGEYPRPMDRWKEIFETHFDTVHIEQFAVRTLGVPFWWLVYFKGTRRT